MKSGGGFRRSTLTVVIGSVLGHAFGMLFTVLLSRLYGPDIFGQFAQVLAVASVFIGVSTFRLEIRAHSSDDSDANALFKLAMLTTGGWSILLGITTAVCVGLGFDYALLYVAPLVALGSLQVIRSAQLARSRRYVALAFQNFFRGASMGGVQYVLGFISSSIESLVAGFLVSRSGGLLSIGILRRPATSLRETVRKFWVYGCTAGTTALVNSFAGQAPLLLIGALYGSVEAGLFAMMLRLLVSPMTIVGQAASSATLGEIGRIRRGGEGDASRFVKRASRDLAFVGLVPCAFVAVAGPWLSQLLMGEEWRRAGALMAVMSIGALVQFAIAPMSQLLNITGKSSQLLRWDILRLVTYVLAIVVPSLLGASLVGAVLVYSIAHLPVYGSLFYLVHASVSGKYDPAAPQR